MTISYDEEFSSLMLRWRGSLWKAVLKDLIAFYIGYYIILAIQWYVLDEKQKEYFTGWIHWCEIGSQYIPLSFLLGFFVSVIVARWWEQFNWISWPDKMMMMVSACLPGKENLAIRQAIARWSSLQAAIAWSGISVRTLKRFPTERHMVEAKLMTEEEYDMYMSLEAPHGKWFVPIMWIVNLLKKQYALKKIDSIQMDMLLKQVYSWRDGFAMLFVYDWVKIPLVYTQVVAIATYGYFFICLIGRQPKLDQKSMETVSGIKFFSGCTEFVPIMWIVNLLKKQYALKKIDSIQMDMLLKQVYSWRDGFAMLFVYDWVKIPLVYTQVVAIATYGYFFICLIGRQPKLDQKSMETEITILFPIFTTFQMLFYLGWLKVGQFLMNPFGEDDDDFELNYVLDRNTYIAHMMATEIADQCPDLEGPPMEKLIPHTRASFKIQDVIPKSHLASFKLTENEMKLVKQEDIEECERLIEQEKKGHRRRLGLLVRAIDEAKK
ncbi:bestrophin-3 domain protein [Oesophagostomum dentatum]|uniref:Bestrophin homolog n=2 Tax=Strongylidae TaxID=27830 RepID=A0A0B1T063_OESDE|nr:bestrophin-3 domain protein [Oesophagostomum dentatum]